MSFGQEMERRMVLLVFLFLIFQSFDAFTLKKRYSPLLQPNPFWAYQDVHEKNYLRKPGSIGVKIEEPIQGPSSYQDFAEKNEDHPESIEQGNLLKDIVILTVKR